VIYQSNINIDGPMSTLMIMKNEEVVVSFIGIVHLINPMKATLIANTFDHFHGGHWCQILSKFTLLI
jgi:hypothetical protein